MTVSFARPTSRKRVYYIGIDPGGSGGMAVIGGSGCVHTSSMPKDTVGIWEWILWHCSPPSTFDRSQGTITYYAVIERVQGFIGPKTKGGIGETSDGQFPGSAMFKLGMSYGRLLMALEATGTIYQDVPPQTWQKAVGIIPRKKSETRTAWKNRLKDYAEILFPDEKLTLATADALLIAYYCRQLHEDTNARANTTNKVPTPRK